MFLTEKLKGVGDRYAIANAAKKCFVYKKFFPYSHSICCFAVNVCTHKHRGQFRVNGNFAVGLALNSHFLIHLIFFVIAYLPEMQQHCCMVWFGWLMHFTQCPINPVPKTLLGRTLMKKSFQECFPKISLFLRNCSISAKAGLPRGSLIHPFPVT